MNAHKEKCRCARCRSSRILQTCIALEGLDVPAEVLQPVRDYAALLFARAAVVREGTPPE